MKFGKPAHLNGHYLFFDVVPTTDMVLPSSRSRVKVINNYYKDNLAGTLDDFGAESPLESIPLNCGMPSFQLVKKIDFLTVVKSIAQEYGKFYSSIKNLWKYLVKNPPVRLDQFASINANIIYFWAKNFFYKMMTEYDNMNVCMAADDFFKHESLFVKYVRRRRSRPLCPDRSDDSSFSRLR